MGDPTVGAAVTDPSDADGKLPVQDERVPSAEFDAFIERMPQVCVEVVVATDRGVLLGKRTGGAAAGEWFWPGGRLYKGERLAAAARRVASDELGLDVTVERRLGVFEHFWTAEETGARSRHTVNVVFLVRPDADPVDVALDDQHSDVTFATGPREDFHDYVNAYFERFDLPTVE